MDMALMNTHTEENAEVLLITRTCVFVELLLELKWFECGEVETSFDHQTQA